MTISISYKFVYLAFYFVPIAKKPVVQSHKMKANPVTCEVCEYAMQYLDSMLSDNATEEEIRQGLDQLCGYLPASVSGEVSDLLTVFVFESLIVFTIMFS